MALTIAFIPLNPKAKWSSAKIQQYLSKKWPDLPEPKSEDTPDDSQIVFSLGKSHVIIAHIPDTGKEDIVFLVLCSFTPKDSFKK